jgi:hypothetical protein
MGQNTNLGQTAGVTVFGNPESFKKLISSHGLTCKIKQALICPCVANNAGSPDLHCNICNGDGYVYTYQRRFLVSDENSKSCSTKIYPFWNPILSVKKVQNVTSEVQGGITDLEVDSFDSTSITLVNPTTSYEKKRVTYTFDGWTYVEEEKLRVDVENKLMYADGTIFDAEYQSSNPLNAFADIADVVRIWNKSTGKQIVNFTVEGNTISTTETIDADNMYIEYYYADLTEVIAATLGNRDNNEVWTHDLKSGECKMAFYPFWELSKGDLIVLSASALYKNEQIEHRGTMDKLWEVEVFQLNDKIFDASGNIYYIDTDYILQGRYIKWIGSKPTDGTVISIRYGYKPAYIVFEDNPYPNNLENKQYPIEVLAKSWSKISKDDLARLIS